jgi:hypothetical protein
MYLCIGREIARANYQLFVASFGMLGPFFPASTTTCTFFLPLLPQQKNPSEKCCKKSLLPCLQGDQIG